MNHPNGSRTNRRRDANPTVAEIRAARDQAGLTQTEAARRIHSTLRAWQCWESEGGENRPMHPALFELFLTKTGQTKSNEGDHIDEPVQLGEAVEQYVTRYGLRRIANCQVEPTAASGLRSSAVVEFSAARERGLPGFGDLGRRVNRRADGNGGRKITS